VISPYDIRRYAAMEGGKSPNGGRKVPQWREETPPMEGGNYMKKSLFYKMFRSARSVFTSGTFRKTVS
jgi:hypothetical protein